MSEAFSCAYVRTPIGRFGGALAAVRADDLAALPLQALLRRYPQLDWQRIDDVIFGCANQAGEDNRNVARIAGSAAFELRARKARYALVPLCIGVGQGLALALEAV